MTEVLVLILAVIGGVAAQIQRNRIVKGGD